MSIVTEIKRNRRGQAACDGENRSAALPVLYSILARLSDRGVPHVVIHGRDALHGGRVSDIDLAFDKDPRKVLLPLLRDMQAEGLLTIIQILHYDIPACYYFVLAIDTPNGTGYLHLDCLHDKYGLNRYLIPSTMFLYGRRELDDVYVPMPEVEAAYLLVKKTKKGTLTTESVSYIKQLADTSSILALCETVAGARFREAVSDLLQSDGDSARFAAARAQMMSSLRRAGWRHPLLGSCRLFLTGIRVLGRLVKPTGIFVVLLGPDGSGKSTIASHVLSNIGGGFRRVRHFHWRPGLLPRLGRPRAARHETGQAQSEAPSLKYKYGTLISLLRYGYYLLDFVIGGVLIAFLKRQTAVILAERYYYDYFVHPARYAFRLPDWLFRLGLSVVPKPDLVVLLDNDPEVIWRRKKELPIEEVRRQIAQYRRIVSGTSVGYVVKTEDSASVCADHVVQSILAATAKRNVD